jgi:hypothetical protein
MTYEEFLATVSNGLLVIKELPVPCGRQLDDISESFSLMPHKECDIVLVYGDVLLFSSIRSKMI